MVADDPESFADLDGHCWEWAQHVCNLLNYGHWVDDDHLQAAIKKDADRARAVIARTKNMMINGKSPSDFAASLTDQQAILARKALVYFFAHMVANSLFSACGDADYKCGIVFPIDFSTDSTIEWSAYYRTEGEARALARTKLGSDPVEISPGKWRSRDGKWQYRAKKGDVSDDHIHLEELNPQTGEVIQNLHLRWPGNPNP
jgi:hypothetical protein